MGELIGDFIVRCIPILLPAALLISLLMNWGILPDGTEKKEKKPKESGKESKGDTENQKEE